MRKPALSASGRHPLVMLAGENLGRRHHRRLPSGFDHVGHRQERDDGLARADVALQQPDHALLRPEIGADVVDRLQLRLGQRKGQRGLEAPAERPFGEMRAAGNCAHAGAHEKERELVGEKLVVGEPGRGRTGRVDVLGPSGAVHRAERIGEARQLQPAQGLFADPFRQPRQPLQRAVGGAGDRAHIEPLGQPIDGLDRGQAGELLGVHHPIGMDDLPPSVPKLELAGDPARRADRQARAHPVVVGEEEHQLHVAGVVLDQHLERRARARVRRLAMLRHLGLDGDDRVGNGVADLGARAPVDGRLGQVEQDVDDARALRLVEQPVEQFRVLRPDPRQGAGRGEQRVEQGRAHGTAL